MFNNPRYLTSGIQARVPLLTQLALWSMVNNAQTKGLEVDYLQVFELYEENGKQKVRHFQEEPPFEEIITFGGVSSEEIVVGKIYVIDDYEHSTMLFAEEY